MASARTTKLAWTYLQRFLSLGVLVPGVSQSSTLHVPRPPPSLSSLPLPSTAPCQPPRLVVSQSTAAVSAISAASVRSSSPLSQSGRCCCIPAAVSTVFRPRCRLRAVSTLSAQCICVSLAAAVFAIRCLCQFQFGHRLRQSVRRCHA